MSAEAGPVGLDPDGLYHLATVQEWDRYRDIGSIEPVSLVEEGFVHCSWGRQVVGTLAKHFVGVQEVLAVRLDSERLGVKLIEEDTHGAGQAFPHAYGAIPMTAVMATISVSDRPR